MGSLLPQTLPHVPMGFQTPASILFPQDDTHPYCCPSPSPRVLIPTGKHGPSLKTYTKEMQHWGPISRQIRLLLLGARLTPHTCHCRTPTRSSPDWLLPASPHSKRHFLTETFPEPSVHGVPATSYSPALFSFLHSACHQIAATS